MGEHASVDAPNTGNSIRSVGAVPNDAFLQFQQARMMAWEDATHRFHDKTKRDEGKGKKEMVAHRLRRCREKLDIVHAERKAATTLPHGRWSRSGSRPRG